MDKEQEEKLYEGIRRIKGPINKFLEFARVHNEKKTSLLTGKNKLAKRMRRRAFMALPKTKRKQLLSGN